MNRERGVVLIAVMMALVLVAAIALMLSTESAVEAERTGRGTEALQADYLAQAALQHALWQTDSLECAGDFAVPTTQLGAHSYVASATGGGTTTAYSLSTDQDAWIRNDQPTTNNGSAATQHIRFETGNIEQALFRFDLSSLPAGAQINSASASFYVAAGGMGGGPHPEGPVTVHRVTSDWTEADATWDTMNGNFDAQVLAMITPQTDIGAEVRVNLTAQVQAWVNGDPNYGVLLAARSEGIHAQYVSTEGALAEHPRLDVVVGTTSPTSALISATGTLDTGVARSLQRTVSGQQAPTGAFLEPVGDVYLKQDAANLNFGASNDLWVEDPGAGGQGDNSLIQFDIGLIPRGARVTRATLEVYAYAGYSSAPGASIGVHRVTRDWVAGTNDGASGSGATWNESEPGMSWSSAGGDYDATAVVTVDAAAGTTGWYRWDVTTLVNGWSVGTYPNQGLILVAENDSTLVGFRGSDYSNASQRPKLTLAYACECGSACLAPQGTGTIAMVVVNPTTLVPADAYKKALFESWGYTVDVISESANQAEYDAKAASSDVFFISETVNSNQVGDKLVNVSIGVVSQDGSYNSDLGLAGGSSWPVTSAINVADPSHYITAVFPAGALDIYSGAMEQLTVSGGAAAGLQTLADTSGAGSLVVLDTGAALLGGGSAAGRRVMLPLGREGRVNWDYLNSNGRLIVQRALAWGMNAGVTPGAAGKLLLVVGDAVSPVGKDSDRKALFESWGYAVTLIDDGADQLKFDTETAANDVIYVSGTIIDLQLANKLTGSTTSVVNEDWNKLDNFGFADTGYNITYDRLAVTDPLHYISDPFGGAEVIIATAGITMTTAYGTVAPDLQFVGEVVGNLPGLATLDAGAQRWDATPAPARRVQVPFQNAEISQLTADGVTLMKRSIEWAATASGGSTYAVLMIVADPASPAQAAADRKTLMESWGYSVTLIDDDDSTVNLITAIDVADVIYVGAGTTNTDGVIKILANIPKGVVNEPSLLVSNIGFSSGINVAFAVDALTIINGTHSITQGLASPTTVYTALAVPTVLSGTLSPDLQNLGEFLGAPALAVLESGAARHNTGVTPGRRAQLPFEAAVGSDLTADGQLIVRRAIEWAATAPAPAYNVLLIVGNATTLGTKDAGYKALMESWGHTVAVIDDGDSQAVYDAAMAAADVVYATGSAVGASMLDKATDTTKGMVNEVNGKIDNFGFSSSTTATANFSAFSTTDAAHYITEPFGGNAVTVFAASLTNPVPGGTLAPDLQNAGAVVGTLALGTLEVGATRHDGNPSQGRRAHLPFTSAETTDMTADGQIILQRTLEWAAGAGAGAGAGGGGGGGGIVFEEFTEGRQEVSTSSALSMSIPKPTGTMPGDLLIVAVATDDDTVATLSPSATWNLTQLDIGAGAGAVTLGVWWKIADGTETTSLRMDWVDPQQAYGWIMRFTGHDPSSPIATASMNSGNNRDPQSNNLITGSDGNLILRLGGFDDDDITLDAPGLSGHTVITMDRSNTGNLNTVSGGAGYVIQTTAGDTGTSNFNLTAREQYRTVTLAIRPAP